MDALPEPAGDRRDARSSRARARGRADTPRRARCDTRSRLGDAASAGRSGANRARDSRAPCDEYWSVTVNVFLWHVHGAWTTAFVHGPHRYFVPVTADRGPDGRGRARTYEWPNAVAEVTREEAAELDPDVVVLQRPHELEHL